MSEWQPIETAPKDGRWFFVDTPARIPAYARYGVSNGKFSLNIHVVYELHGREEFSPTCWQEVPEPPK